MSITCQCGATLPIITVRLTNHEDVMVRELTILVHPCTSCGETRYQQGYDDRIMEESRERIASA